MSKTLDPAKPKEPLALDRPMMVRWRDADRFLWGDDTSHRVNDIIYGRNAKIGTLFFTLKPGGLFRASHDWKPIYEQDRFYYVWQGELTIQDPETGDVLVVRRGEAVTWRGARWHYAYNFTQEETIVIDWYAPQVRAPGVSWQEVSQAMPELPVVQPGRLDLLGRWPMSRPANVTECHDAGRMMLVTQADALHFVHGDEHPVRESLYVSTAELSAGAVDLMPSQRSDTRSHPGDKIILTESGIVNVLVDETGEWFEMHEGDLVYLPPGTAHQYWNYRGEPARLMFLVVPDYQ